MKIKQGVTHGNSAFAYFCDVVEFESDNNAPRDVEIQVKKSILCSEFSDKGSAIKRW